MFEIVKRVRNFNQEWVLEVLVTQLHDSYNT